MEHIALEELGLRITQARRKKKWSQKDLADAAGVSQQTVSQVELGRVEKISSVQLVARAVGIEVELSIRLPDSDEGAA